MTCFSLPPLPLCPSLSLHFPHCCVCHHQGPNSLNLVNLALLQSSLPPLGHSFVNMIPHLWQSSALSSVSPLDSTPKSLSIWRSPQTGPAQQWYLKQLASVVAQQPFHGCTIFWLFHLYRKHCKPPSLCSVSSLLFPHLYPCIRTHGRRLSLLPTSPH